MMPDYPDRDVQTAPSGGGIGLPDIYFLLFRRKWLILGGLILGICAAVFIWKTRQPLFQSSAKLIVKYVLETRAPAGLGSDQVRTPDAGLGTLINAEMEILKSLDVAMEVAATLTPDKILPKDSDGKPSKGTVADAAGMIMSSFRVDNPNRGNIITLRFDHPDPTSAQRILEQIIETYLKKHHEVHRAGGWFDDVFIQQRDQLRLELTQTEDRLKQLKTKAGVASLDAARKLNAEQTATLRQELFKVDAELAQHRAVLDEIRKVTPTKDEPIAPVAPVMPSVMDEHRKATARIEQLEQRELSLLLVYTLDNPQAKTNRLLLEEARQAKAKLEKEHPGLVQLPVSTPAFGGATTAAVGPDASSLLNLVRSFEAKRGFLTNQLGNVRAEAALIEQAESEITELQRRREFFESQLAYVERNLHQTKFDQELSSRKGANISRVQAPSPAYRDFKDVYKKTGMGLLGGIGAGLVLAFLMELVFDRTLKRSKDVEGVLQVPLFLSIPVLALGSRARAVTKGKPDSANGVEKGNGSPPAGEALKPYHEALRDRLVTYFDIRHMTHKPKLIAVTSCLEGAGVSSVANGLAASLSDTGDGNVLLVNMRGERGAAHAFCHGKPACGLADALNDETRDSALVDENLYVVSAESLDRQLQPIAPRQFSTMVPRLKASDYDYIIFDMPPVGQTSITSKVARFMDMVLMVIESNKTDRDSARRACALLAESKATVATVLNKQRRYVPRWLQPDFH